MAAKSIENKLQLEVTCFLCMEYFIDPVTLDCGHSFCHACILELWGQVPQEPICPRCKQEVPRLNFKPNRQLASIVGLIKELNDQAQAAEKVEVCKEHQEAQKTFCKDDLSLFCSGCDTSKVHQTHNVIPAAEAVEEYKGNFLSHIEALKKEKEEILIHKADAEKQCQDLLVGAAIAGKLYYRISSIVLTETEKNQMLAELKALQDLAGEKSSSWVDKIENVKEEILAKRDDHVAILNREITTIEKITQDLEAKCQQLGLEFLQDVGSTLKNCRKTPTFVNPVPFPPEVKAEIWELRDFNALLQSAVERFEETLISGFQQKKENVTFDPDMAQPKRRRLSDEPQDPQNI
ncbi:E3 ubiquitin-protein ligase TRIM7-like [Elgaria multicarinata webbii]|uniref:E3 ubiquitin-protein ligase TRIM7-like n=1 Tax=Elgaria multicarinata webbii TaxID=159646 RepID=UPI002FCD3257